MPVTSGFNHLRTTFQPPRSERGVVVQVRPARAVVPPPRLRATPPPFSAPLRHRVARFVTAALGDPGMLVSLRNPAEAAALRARSGRSLEGSPIGEFFGCPSGRGYRLPGSAHRAYVTDLERLSM